MSPMVIRLTLSKHFFIAFVLIKLNIDTYVVVSYYIFFMPGICLILINGSEPSHLWTKHKTFTKENVENLLEFLETSTLDLYRNFWKVFCFDLSSKSPKISYNT